MNEADDPVRVPIWTMPILSDAEKASIREFQDMMRKYGQRTFGLKPGVHNVVTAPPKTDPPSIYKPGDVLMTNGTKRTMKDIYDSMVKAQSQIDANKTRKEDFGRAVSRLFDKFDTLDETQQRDLIKRIHEEVNYISPIVAGSPHPLVPLDALDHNLVPLDDPEPVSDLSRKFRRRWVDGKYVDERIA